MEDTGKVVEQKRPKIIVLCGSTKFKPTFLAMLENLTIGGNIVLLPGYYGHQPDAMPIGEGIKESLDKLHKQKIEMSDIVYIINKDGYIGESTRAEIEFATILGKEIRYYEEIKN